MTDQEIVELPATIDFVTAGRALGISRAHCYALLKAGKFPVETFRIGTRTRVAKHKLLAYLGITPAA